MLRLSPMTKVSLTTCLYPQLTLLYTEARSRDGYEMSIHISGRKSEASGATGSNAPVGEIVCEVQAGSSTQPLRGVQKGSSFNSGEHSTLS